MIYVSSIDIERLDENSLKAFLQKKYRENSFLDYKLKYEKPSIDETREEFLADITGFANYYGGNIIIGVEELEDEGASSQPGELIGIEDGDKWSEAHRNLCDTSIDPPIHGLVIKEIFLKNGKWAIVVYIPPSLRRPHMVTFRGRNRFYIRHDDRTVKMTTDEVKRTVIDVISIENTLDSYIKMVEEEIIEDFIGTDFSLLMHAIPFLLQEEQIDTSSEDIKSAFSDRYLYVVEGMDLRCSPMPNIHGVSGTIYSKDPLWMTYVHRTGYIGFAYNIQKMLSMSGTIERIISPFEKNRFLAFLRLSKLVTEKANVSSPYQIRCNFINSRNAKYDCTGGYRLMCTSEIIWKRDRLKLPGVRIDSFQGVEGIANLFFERLRNAFGLE